MAAHGIQFLIHARHNALRLVENTIILYTDVNELTNLRFKLNNVCSITFEDFNARL